MSAPGPAQVELSDDRIATTRAAYDLVAADYERQLRDILQDMPYDRAVLGSFAETVGAHGGRVADLGCGPGRITAHLRELGLDVIGMDLSPAMIAVAREQHPGIEFTQGRLDDLHLEPACLAGIVAWYSIIHVSPSELPGVLAGFRRVLVTGGQLLLAFQAGDDEPREITHAYGHDVALRAWRHAPNTVAAALVDAGLGVRVNLVRDPDGAHESTPQAYLLAEAAPA